MTDYSIKAAKERLQGELDYLDFRRRKCLTIRQSYAVILAHVAYLERELKEAYGGSEIWIDTISLPEQKL